MYSRTREISHLRKFNVVGTKLALARDLRMNDSVIIIESACTRDGALTYLEIEEYKEHNNRRQQARNTRCVTAEESVRQGRDLVRFCQ
jgi:lipid-A-disaccharide synthase-like uncharacterized protein